MALRAEQTGRADGDMEPGRPGFPQPSEFRRLDVRRAISRVQMHVEAMVKTRPPTFIDHFSSSSWLLRLISARVGLMETPLNASSSTAGALMSGGRYKVPQFQREYAWEVEEVTEFFDDLSRALHDDTYFLGLVIFTGDGPTKDIVDGQQRLLTITLLAAALYHRAKHHGRKALAERLQSTFLRSIDFRSDEELPRLELAAAADDATLQKILQHPPEEIDPAETSAKDVSGLLLRAYRILSDKLDTDLTLDPFKRMGLWADFLTNKLYLASFVHPDPASAYRVFEVINTRGKELTTADLLKSYVLSQTATSQREQRYHEWQAIAGHFGEGNASTFVQFIRHAVTTQRGHVPPRDLYDVLAGRGTGGAKRGMPPGELLNLLQRSLPVYLQAMDPTSDGPATDEQLAVFSVLNSLGVLSVRPILLAMMETRNATAGMQALLRLVVRRIVVGNLGTGNVERRFGQAALRIAEDKAWESALEAISDLNPNREEFQSQVHRRSLNKNLLAVIRRSVIQETITPEPTGYLFLIKPRNSDWPTGDEDRAAYWASTIGNSFLASEERRPSGSASWDGFVSEVIPLAVEGEWVKEIENHPNWGISAIGELGEKLATRAAAIWYSQHEY